MDWLKRWSFYDYLPSIVAAHSTASFPQFALLPTELRLQIWEEALPFRRIHVTRPNGYFEGEKCFRYHQLDARTNEQLLWIDGGQIPIVDHESYEVFRKMYDVVELASIRPMAPQLMDERGRIYTELFTDGRYVYDESRQTSFLVRWEQDLVYFADPARTTVFGNFCAHPSSSKAKHVALLIGDLREERTAKGWSGSGLRERLNRTRYDIKDGRWDSIQFDEIMLVILPGLYGDEDPVPEVKRDDFGFVSYDDVCEVGWVLPDWQRIEADRLYGKIEGVLREMFPSLNRPESVRRVLDLDCEVLDDARYQRYLNRGTKRPRHDDGVFERPRLERTATI